MDQWLSRLADDPGHDIEPGADWLREVYRRDGAVTTPWLARLAFERRDQLAADLLADIRRQAEAELGLLPGLEPYVHDGQVMVEDTVIRGVDPAEAAVEVADGVQTFITRARQVIWPECPEHGNGLHPSLDGGGARWICRTGPHPVRSVLSAE